MESKPGVKEEVFYLKFSDDWFNKGDIITNAGPTQLKVIKVYQMTWWKKILIWLGFSVKLFRLKQVKVKIIENDRAHTTT